MNRLALFPLALIACTSSGSDDGHLTVDDLQTEQGIIARADFSAATSIPANPAPAVSVTITDAAARQLFSDTLALPLLGSATYPCPSDFGVTYFVTFSEYSPDTLPITATINPAGCEIATITAQGGSSIAFLTTPSYWTEVAHDLGIAESEIYPYTPPND